MTELIKDVPDGWERVIGQNSKHDVLTSFSDNDWWDVKIYQPERGYHITLVRGPNHPQQSVSKGPLIERVAVDREKVEQVAVAFMLCASEIDPFTSHLTRGIILGEDEG